MAEAGAAQPGQEVQADLRIAWPSNEPRTKPRDPVVVRTDVMLLPDPIEIGQEFPDGTYDNRTHDDMGLPATTGASPATVAASESVLLAAMTHDVLSCSFLIYPSMTKTTLALVEVPLLFVSPM